MPIAYRASVNSRFHSLTLFSLADSLRLARRAPRCALALLRDSVAGPKGYGMAVMLDVLAGVLSGGRFGGMLGVEPGRGGMAQFFMTIDISRFMPLDQFKTRMDELIDQVHDCPKAPGVDRIYVAGEIEYGLQSRRLAEGLPVEDSVVAELDRLEREPGV